MPRFLRNNKTPFIKVTKGEYLQLLEAAIPKAYQEEKEKIYEKNKDNQKSIDYLMDYLDKKNNNSRMHQRYSGQYEV